MEFLQVKYVKMGKMKDLFIIIIKNFIDLFLKMIVILK